jgi:hypothetical protein
MKQKIEDMTEVTLRMRWVMNLEELSTQRIPAQTDSPVDKLDIDPRNGHLQKRSLSKGRLVKHRRKDSTR